LDALFFCKGSENRKEKINHKEKVKRKKEKNEK